MDNYPMESPGTLFGLTGPEISSILITLSVAIIGWIIALCLQQKSLKSQFKDKVKYDIYKQIIKVSTEMSTPLIGLVNISAPFIFMETSMIPYELGLEKVVDGVVVPYSEEECLLAGSKKWQDFLDKIQDNYFSFGSSYISFLSITQNWESAMKKLKGPNEVFFETTDHLKKKMYQEFLKLRDINSKQGLDWRKWDEGDIEYSISQISQSAGQLLSYTHDMMALVHNELISSYFGHRRSIRKTLDKNLKVLTERGLVESVDWDTVDKMNLWRNIIISRANFDISNEVNTFIGLSIDALKTLTQGKCPHCRFKLEVFRLEETEERTSVDLICGHRLEFSEEDKSRPKC